MLPGPPQKLPNLAQEGDLGAIMAHLGRNLQPTWPILRPSRAHLRPNFAENLHQISPGISRSAPRHPKTTQRVAKGLQDSSGAQIFIVLGSILELIFKFFLQSLLLFFMASLPQVRHGGGLARAAHCMSAAPAKRVVGRYKPRCPACPISNFQLYLMVPGGPPRALKCPRQPP